MGTPLKLEGTNGDLKEMTTAEENYLAYQAGEQLKASAKTEVGAITDASSGNETVGAFTDTRFNQVPGSHGSITTTSTVTTLYQTEGTAAEDGGDFRNAVHQSASSDASTHSRQLHEFTSAEMDTLTDRLTATIFANDYPGTYKLGSSAPSSDYDVHLSGVFTDTRTDAGPSTVTVATYNIYQRQTFTAPTAVRPVSLKRSSGGSGTFQGIQEMSDAEIKYTFGQRAKTRIMSGTKGVGTYILNSSATGAPSETGTWVAKGTATDTRHTTTDTDYTQDFVGTFETTFTGTFESDFVGTFTGERTFTRNSTANFTQGFVGNFAGEQDFTRNSTNTSLYGAVSNFTGNFVGPANFEQTFTGDFTGDFTGNFTGERDFETTFTGTFETDFVGTFETTFTGNFIGALINAGTETIETYTLYVRTA